MSRNAQILSLDIGTSSTRALLYDSLGNAVEDAEVQIHYDQKTTPDGGVETDADGLYERTIDAIRSLLSKAGTKKGEIAGVAVSCFWHSLMGVDENGTAMTPLYSWADTRSRGEVAILSAKLDAEAYHARTGCFLHPSYWPAKLLWLQRTQGDEFRKAHRWVSFAEFLSLQLFGNARCSISMASATGLFDQNKRTWDKKTLSVLPVSEENLLPLADLGESQSGMPEPPAGLEILRDVPWFPALGDGATSNLGAGGASEQRMVINLGTSGAIRVMAERDHIDIPGGLFCYRADSHRFLVGGAVSNAGNVYAWLSRTLKLGEDLSELNKQVAGAEPDGHCLTVLPFWAGERSPGWHVDARAAILGLNLHSSPVDIFQASLEAVAYTFADIRGQLQRIFPHAEEIIVSGGALEHSPAWAQIFADVLGSPVQISRTSEPSGRGAALFVSAALGLIDNLGQAPDVVGKTYHPNPTRQAAYEQALKRYRSYYDRLIAGSA